MKAAFDTLNFVNKLAAGVKKTSPETWSKFASLLSESLTGRIDEIKSDAVSRAQFESVTALHIRLVMFCIRKSEITVSR